jgi:outer membrane protein OmpA-like peptidoglycan-associated protein
MLAAGTTAVGVAAATKPATSAPEPAARPVVKPVPLAKTAATAAVAVDSPDSKKSGGIWKNLLWLLPIILGLWLLKTCSKTPDDAATTTSTAVETTTAPLTKPADTPAQATPPVSATPPAPAAVPEPAAKPADTPVQATPPARAAVPAPVGSTPPVEQHKVDQEKAAAAPATKEAAKPAAIPPVPQTPPTATAKPADTVASTPAAKQAPVAAASVPSAKLYFQVGKINLPVDTKKKLSPIFTYLKANSNAKVAISGFHDPSGNQAINDKLAENRAKKVRAALQAAGIEEGIIVMEKPQSTTGSGSNAEARRVEVSVRP